MGNVGGLARFTLGTCTFIIRSFSQTGVDCRFTWQIIEVLLYTVEFACNPAPLLTSILLNWSRFSGTDH